jgi:DNA modification methylase
VGERIEIGDAVLYHGDCLEILPTLPKVDAVVTDPPYCSGSVSEASRTAAKGQGLRSENIARFGWFKGDNMGTAGLMFLLRAVVQRASERMSEAGSVVVFCDWRMVPNIIPAIESGGLRYQNLLVWNKGHMGLGRGFRAQHELAAVFTNGSPEYHNKGTGNVITVKRSKSEHHQTEKPVELMEKIAAVVCAPAATILDPFMGSGTTGVACANLGRKFIGIEIERKYFDIACERIEAAQAQHRLFA